MKTLEIYGASDDLVEFNGAFYEEYNIHEPTEFDIEFTSPRGVRSFTLLAEFGEGWSLALQFNTGEDVGDEGACDPEVCRIDGVLFRHVGKNNDPFIRIPVYDDEIVTVTRIGDDEDDEDY